MIIGISGKSGCGKNTVAEILQTYLKLKGHEFKIIAFADTLKDSYCQNKGITREQLEQEKDKHRTELQNLGEYMRAKDPGYWINKLASKIDPAKDNVIIADVRYRNEASWIRGVAANPHEYKTSKGILLRVSTLREIRASRRQLIGESHASETELDCATGIFLAIVRNNTTLDDLTRNLKPIAEQIAGIIPEFTLKQ